MMVWKMIFLFQVCILRFHVNLPGCIPFCFVSHFPKSTIIASPNKNSSPNVRPLDINPPGLRKSKIFHPIFFLCQRLVLRLNSLGKTIDSATGQISYESWTFSISRKKMVKIWLAFFLNLFWVVLVGSIQIQKNKLHISWNIPGNIPLGHQSSWL